MRSNADDSISGMAALPIFKHNVNAVKRDFIIPRTEVETPALPNKNV
jgi:hypothetical protein